MFEMVTTGLPGYPTSEMIIISHNSMTSAYNPILLSWRPSHLEQSVCDVQGYKLQQFSATHVPSDLLSSGTGSPFTRWKKQKKHIIVWSQKIKFDM